MNASVNCVDIFLFRFPVGCEGTGASSGPVLEGGREELEGGREGGGRREEGGGREGALCTNGWQYLREGRDLDPAGTSLAVLLHERGGGKLKEGEEGGDG